MNSVSKNILELLKVVAQNQIQLAKKVDEMNTKLEEFFNEATTEPPVDLVEFSIGSKKNKSDNSSMFDEFVLKEKERRTPKKKVKAKSEEAVPSKVRIISGSDGSDVVDDDMLVKPEPDKIKPSDSTKEKLRKLGMELPSLNKAIPELADIEKAKVLEAEIAREQKKADLKKPKEEVKDN